MSKLKISYYGKTIYTNCPLAYNKCYLQRKEKIQLDKRNAFEGSVWHGLMEDWFRMPVHRDVSWLYEHRMQYVKDFLDKNKCIFKGNGDYERSVETVNLFIDNCIIVLKEEGLVDREVKSEWTIKVPLGEIEITGRVDLVAFSNLSIYDWKGVKDVRRLVLEQLGFYNYLVSKITNEIPKKCCFVLGYYGETFNLDASWPLSRIEDSYLKVAESILAQEFDATPGEANCKWCDYYDDCEEKYDFKSAKRSVKRSILNAERNRIEVGESPRGYHSIKI